MKPEPYIADRVWKLPPLILHPFSDASSLRSFSQSSRASLDAQGCCLTRPSAPSNCRTILLEGRYCEVRMLYYVGKDLSGGLTNELNRGPREPRFAHRV